MLVSPTQDGEPVRVIVTVAIGLALILVGCGGSAVSSPPASETPAPSPSEAVMRNLKIGEHVGLACGLSLTVPARYQGYYAAGGPDPALPLDAVGSRSLAQTSLMHSLMAQSIAPASTIGLVGRGWPLVASSGAGTVEVRSVAVRVGTPKALSMISVIVRLPGQPTGDVTMMVYGRKASDAPQVVLDQANSMWTLFDVKGAALPSASQ
jgi:hypothetical protein